MNYTSVLHIVTFSLLTATQLCTAMEKPTAEQTPITIFRFNKVFNRPQVQKILNNTEAVPTALFEGHEIGIDDNMLEQSWLLLTQPTLSNYTEYDSIEPLLHSNLIPSQQKNEVLSQLTQKEHASYCLTINKKFNNNTIKYNMFFTLKNK